MQGMPDSPAFPAVDKGERIHLNDNIKIIIRRFAELVITCFIISGFIALLSKMGILVERKYVVVALLIGALMFFLIQVKMLRNCYYDMQQFYREYYLTNTFAYLLFVLVCYLIYFFCADEVYTWLFAITKWVRFTVNRIEIYLSALLFHAVGLACVFLSPAGVITENFDDR